jgi:GT2 family glycosyltransferase
VPFEIIVVDNASDDRTSVELLSRFPSVHTITNTVNEGFARGNNIGLAAARGNILLLLGSDTEVTGGSIQRMYDHLVSHPEVGAVSCRLVNPDGTEQRSCRRFPTLGDALFTYLSLHSLAPRYNMADFDFHRTQDVDQPAATCFMLRRTALCDGQLFDERLSILYNDVDLCKRIRAAGWRIVYLADAEVVHAGSQSTARATPELRLEMYRNILVYYFRSFGIPAVLLLLPILAVRLAIVNRGRQVGGLLSLSYLTG